MHEKALTYSAKQDNPIAHATTHNNLVQPYLQLGRIQEAKDNAHLALNIYEKEVSKNHPLYAIALNTVASVHAHEGGYSKAASLCNDALAILKAFYGETHKEVAIAYENLAILYENSGHVDEALAAASKADSIFNAVLGEDSEAAKKSGIFKAQLEAKTKSP